MFRPVRNRQHATTSLIGTVGLVVASVCAHTAAQADWDAWSEQEGPQQTQLVLDEAEFVMTVVSRAGEALVDDEEQAEDVPRIEDIEGVDGPPSTTLSTRLTLDPVRFGAATESSQEDTPESGPSTAWMLAGVAEAQPVRIGSFATRVAPTQLVSTPRIRTRTTLRTGGEFGAEAAQLTPLSGGKEMFAFEVAEGFTFSGVGSRRMWTERDRAFVLSAEAGWKLSPEAGFHLGYEVFQAPLGGILPEDAGSDSIFARFQLRF